MFENREGQDIPQVIFHTRKDNEWVKVHSSQLFANKTVIVFSLPGAFTPTCSGSHVPRFNELAGTFAANGVDEIVCLSVNDAFVMNEWEADQKSANITFIPDGNGEFTEAMGLLVDKNDLGFGKRSWRYSMLVKNGVIKKMFIEDDGPGDPYEVSDADTMLDYINPKASRPEDIVLFTRSGCPFCSRAKGILHDAGIDFEEIKIGRDTPIRSVRAITGANSVPQMFANGKYIGDSDAIADYFKVGQAA
jgi:glutaredoxin-like protein